MKDVTWGAGVALATALAGPIFATPLLIVMSWPDISVQGVIVSVLGMIFLTMPIGAILSIIPNTVGAALLGWLGTHHPAARHPLAWLLTGVALGALIGFAAVPDLRHPGAMLVMAAVGAACALLCRRGTEWID